MQTLLEQLKTDFPGILFVQGEHFYWSPKTATITYSVDHEHENQAITLLHELAHAVLKHASFMTDFELLLMEVAAWDKAQSLGKIYSVEIPEDHIQRCIDTYRDWLYLRSTCPKCSSNGLQHKRTRQYSCVNCGTCWSVSSSRLCRPYRQMNKVKNTLA